jgi:Transposase, Mutator family
MNGLPDLRSLPDAPVPDGRTVLTNRDARGAEAVMGHGRHLRRFILETNPLERFNKEVGRRTDVVGIFPDDQSLIRLAGMLCIEQNDCHEGRAGRCGGPSSPRRRLGACQLLVPDARRTTCSISASTGAPAARRGAH